MGVQRDSKSIAERVPNADLLRIVRLCTVIQVIRVAAVKITDEGESPGPNSMRRQMWTPSSTKNLPCQGFARPSGIAERERCALLAGRDKVRNGHSDAGRPGAVEDERQARVVEGVLERFGAVGEFVLVLGPSQRDEPQETHRVSVEDQVIGKRVVGLE